MRFASATSLRRWVLAGLVCTLIAAQFTPAIGGPGEAENTTTTPNDSGDKSSCIQCPDTPPPCPSKCPAGKKCFTSVRACNECPKTTCVNVEEFEIPVADQEEEEVKGNNKVLPAIVASAAFVVLCAAGYGYVRYRNRQQHSGNGSEMQLDGRESKSWPTDQNVIHIGYIPSPTPSDNGIRVSQISAGTTPLASPMHNPYAVEDPFADRNAADEDDDAAEMGTVKQATIGSATVVTAARAKPALVRLNTLRSKRSNTDLSIKSGGSGGDGDGNGAGNGAGSGNSNGNGNSSGDGGTRPSSRVPTTPRTPRTPRTPKTPLTGNSMLSVHTTSVPNTPTSFHGENDQDPILPRVEVERSSHESQRPVPASDTLASPPQVLDQERQSFGLFGSDEVEGSKKPPSTQNSALTASNVTTDQPLQRESIVSSASTNERFTMMSDLTDNADGEIMIFWGGNAEQSQQPADDTGKR